MPPSSRISARVAAIAPSATLAVDAKAKALKAAGEPVIGFGAGEPDFPTPDHIVEAAVVACRTPAFHKYTPAAGLPDLREAIAVKTKRDSGYEVTAAQVLVTNGGKHAVYNTFATLLDPGDEVLLPAPYWTTYPEPIRLAGGVPVVLPTDESTGFRVTVDQLEAAVTDRTKVLMFVSPSNPTGAVYPPAEVEAIGRWAAERGHLGRHRRDLRAPHLRRPCVQLDRHVGARARRPCRRAQRRGQDLRHDRVAGRLDDRSARRGEGRLEPAVARHLQRGQRLAGGGAGRGERRPRAPSPRCARPTTGGAARWSGCCPTSPRCGCSTPQGAFYAFPNLSAYVGRTIRGVTPADTVELCGVLLDEAKVALVPGEAFDAPGYARMSFALGDDDLAEGCGRIADLLAEAG